jgi:hypothetical protein
MGKWDSNNEYELRSNSAVIRGWLNDMQAKYLPDAEPLYVGNLTTGGIYTLDSLASYELAITAIYLYTFCDDSVSQNASIIWLDATAGGGSDINIIYTFNDSSEPAQVQMSYPNPLIISEDGDLKLTFTASGATDPYCVYGIYGTLS